MKLDLDRIIDRNETKSAKWEAMQMLDRNADDSTLPLWVADMDFACSPAILKALHDRIDREIFGYSFHQAGEFTRAVCGWYLRKYNWFVNSEDLFFSPGVVPAIGYLINILTEEGDGVIIQQPVYYPFTNMTNAHKRTLVNNALINNEGYYEIDFADFEEKAKDPKTKLFILCHPHNPVGRVWTTDELKKMADICAANNVIIISDEIHYDLTREGVEHIPLEVVCKEHRNIIVTCNAPSKTFNLAGMQMSNIIIHNPEIKEKWNVFVSQQISVASTTFSVVAAMAAYYESDGWLKQVRAYLDDNAKLIKDYLAEHAPKLKFRIPDATYLGWIDYRAYNLDNAVFFAELVKSGKVLLEDGVMFGEAGRGFLRINFATPRALLQEALSRLVKILNRVRKGDEARDFEYTKTDGSTQSFFETLKANDKTALVFLRYVGCTICQSDLIKLADNIDALKAKGITPLVLLQGKNRSDNGFINDLPFEVVFDETHAIYEKYNVYPAITMASMISPPVVKSIGEAMAKGLKHGDYEGNEQQLPAVFVIDNNKTVEFACYLDDLDTSGVVDKLVQ